MQKVYNIVSNLENSNGVYERSALIVSAADAKGAPDWNPEALSRKLP